MSGPIAQPVPLSRMCIEPRCFYLYWKILIVACFASASYVHAAPPAQPEKRASIVREERDIGGIPADQTEVVAVGLSSHGFEMLLDRRNITHLTIIEGDFRGAELFRKMGAVKSLRHLVLNDGYRGREESSDWRDLFSFLVGLELRSLVVERCNRISDLWLRDIAKIKSLEVLSLNTCSDVSSAAYEELAALTQVNSLSLSSAYTLDGPSAQKLFATMTKLETLSVTGCFKLSESGISSIARLGNLKNLVLESPSASSGLGLRALAALTQLRRLSLIHYELSDSDVSCIVGAMSLRECAISGDVSGEFIFSGAKALSDLVYLQIESRNEWSKDGLTALANLPRLQQIVLKGRGLCGNSVIPALLSMKCLVGVDLYDARSLEVESLKQLVQKKELTRLIAKQLESIDGKVLERLEAEFVKARPERQVWVRLVVDGRD